MRKEFIPFVGQYAVVTGCVVAFGRRWYRHRKYVPQLLLSDIELKINNRVYQMDHSWIELGKYLAEANIAEYSKIQFTAKLAYYIKRNMSIPGTLQKDICLENIGNMKILETGHGENFFNYWNTISMVVGEKNTDEKIRAVLKKWRLKESLNILY